MKESRFSRVVHGSIGLAVVGVTLTAFAHSSAASPKLEGKVTVDGSSTVAPITTAASEMFQGQNPGVRVPVGVSGTGGGFKKFLAAEADLRTDISGASRPISEKEIALAKQVGVEYIEIPIAIDGLAVVVNPANAFVDHLTVAELKKIWEPGSTINNWSQVRAGFPDKPLKLYGPGTDSGTFDYFTEVIVGEAKASRSDYTASENDNVLVRGVTGDEGALGYFGYSYYENNEKKLKLVPIATDKHEPIKPTLETIRDGTYTPLARPLFFYVNKKSYERPEVKAFVDFILAEPAKIVEHPRVRYVGLPKDVYDLARQRVAAGKTGSAMAAAAGSRDLAEIFRKH